MTDSANLAPIDWDVEDEKRFDALRARSDYAELPSLDLAMWPGDFRSKLDVSDYNDRYLVGEYPSIIWYILYLASGWHTVALLVCVFRPLFLGDFDFYSLLGYFLISIPALGMLLLTFVVCRIPLPVFNRQAQVVHVNHSGHIIHVPWRNIKPFTSFAPTKRLLIFQSSTPKFIRDNPNAKLFQRYLRKDRPLGAGGIVLDPLDGVGVESNLQRLEFIRRYMEQGVSAIQPTPGETPYKPELHPMKRARAEGLSFYRVFMECVYWFGAGPLMDAWIDFWRKRADWPDEVYRLCAPDADLSGFDTTPVRPRDDMFYRYDLKRGGYYLCDRDGKRID